jgi:predicted lipid-binding transport protein (Tim44 family)
MQVFSDPLNLILMAAIAVIFWRFRSVLGQRTGLERPPFTPPAKPKPNLTVIENPEFIPPSPVWQGHADEGSELAKKLEAIAKQDKEFSVTSFIVGAKYAHEMILESFAKGDRATLKPLLSKSVFDSFASVIEDNKTQNRSKIFQFVGSKSTKIENANIAGSKASISVKFESEIINATLDKDGKTISGDDKLIIDDIDLWTFERDLKSRDPNWLLTATGE